MDINQSPVSNHQPTTSSRTADTMRSDIPGTSWRFCCCTGILLSACLCDQEMAWATHLALAAVVAPSPKPGKCFNYARCINQVSGGTGTDVSVSVGVGVSAGASVSVSVSATIGVLYLFLAKVWIHCLFLAKIGVLYFYLLLAKIGALYLFLARTCLADGAAQAVYQPLYRWNSIINCVLTRFFDVYLASAGMTIYFLKGTGCGFCVKGIELWAQVVILILLGPPQKMVGVPRSCHCNCQCQ